MYGVWPVALLFNNSSSVGLEVIGSLVLMNPPAIIKFWYQPSDSKAKTDGARIIKRRSLFNKLNIFSDFKQTDLNFESL